MDGDVGSGAPSAGPATTPLLPQVLGTARRAIPYTRHTQPRSLAAIRLPIIPVLRNAIVRTQHLGDGLQHSEVFLASQA
jgi:hypothetical protein